MNLKNYTSTVPASRSIERIKNVLRKLKVSNINEEYKDGALLGIKFLIDINGSTVVFELPAQVDKVFNVMWLEVKRQTESRKEVIREQAERTAWKIICDWIEVQASMIYLEQAELLQVFLPYAVMPTGKTVYHTIKEGGMKLLTQ